MVRSRREHSQIALNGFKRPLQAIELNLDAYAVGHVEVDDNAP
jgi:hypothetical protein